jgi:hypothetical protein
VSIAGEKYGMQTRPPTFVDLLFRPAAGKCGQRSCAAPSRQSDGVALAEPAIEAPRTNQAGETGKASR